MTFQLSNTFKQLWTQKFLKEYGSAESNEIPPKFTDLKFKSEDELNF